MKSYKNLNHEAQQHLSAFDTQLKNANSSAYSAKKQWFKTAVLPMLALPFLAGFLIFKKSRSGKIIPQKQTKASSSSWLPHIANEALMIFLNNWIINFMKQKKSTSAQKMDVSK